MSMPCWYSPCLPHTREIQSKTSFISFLLILILILILALLFRIEALLEGTDAFPKSSRLWPFLPDGAVLCLTLFNWGLIFG